MLFNTILLKNKAIQEKLDTKGIESLGKNIINQTRSVMWQIYSAAFYSQ